MTVDVNSIYYNTINNTFYNMLNNTLKRVDMHITANELKTKGVSVIESNLGDNDELIITVRGKESYVVMNMDHYNYLRECELEAALLQAKAEVESGDYVIESVNDHIKRIVNDL